MILAAGVGGTKVTAAAVMSGANSIDQTSVAAPFTAMQHPRQNAEKPLAQGLRMVKMGTLSCGAPGTRPRGVQ
jgi:hypothetical protein